MADSKTPGLQGEVDLSETVKIKKKTKKRSWNLDEITATLPSPMRLPPQGSLTLEETGSFGFAERALSNTQTGTHPFFNAFLSSPEEENSFIQVLGDIILRLYQFPFQALKQVQKYVKRLEAKKPPF